MELKLCCSTLRYTSSSSTKLRLHFHFHLRLQQQQQQQRKYRRRLIGNGYVWKSKKPNPKIQASGSGGAAAAESGGGKMVVELVGAFNQLTENTTTTSSSKLLFDALKLSLPLLHSLPLSPDGRSPLSKTLSLALLLADHLHMDAEVISAALLRPILDAAALSLSAVSHRLGPPTAHLLHDSLRLSNSLLLDFFDLDPESASAARKFCLTFYDIRAVVLELGLMLDTMRHLDHLPRYHQQMIALRVLHIHAPLAHAILGSHFLSFELEDLSFRYLFPYSYLYLDAWLRSHHNHPNSSSSDSINFYKNRLLESLKSDPILGSMVSGISVKGRYKSRYSTMKKLLRDGRKPEEVHDVLGLRVILETREAQEEDDGVELLGERACYRAREIIRTLWNEVPHRTKDYIAKPKPNGYKSLHMAVDVSEDGDDGRTRPLMEIQIRTSLMDALADGGTASHSLYKGGLTDPQEAKRLKAIMMAAAELAALRLKDLRSPNLKGMEIDQRDRVFSLLDKNGDGRISIEELMEVMEELGAPREDAREMMQLLDANKDGSLSSDEFDSFQKQVEFMQKMEDRDDEYKTMLNEKLEVVVDNKDSVEEVYNKEDPLPGYELAN